MRLGVGLPTHLGAPPDRGMVLDWATLADDSGFVTLSVHDRPNHWTWEPLTALAAAAVVTDRIRLMTTALLLPTRPENLVAKQAAVIDHLSRGRLDLGLAPGARPPDFELFGMPFENRGRRFELQLASLVAAWRSAREDTSGEISGPAPLQEPHPPLWIGGYAEAALGRAVRYGTGYIFGAAGPEAMRNRIPAVREAATRAGRDLKIAGLAYIAVDTRPDIAARSEQHLLAYYGSLHRPFEDLVHVGTGAALAEQLDAYRAAGLDQLILLPTVPELEQLEVLAGEVLPSFEE
jgi:alkanesulfonate monooxygenase SsuD/methylene tetrahydromethanopterin reductase-like flavin-dependent oxidoreductase (luciferase family)